MSDTIKRVIDALNQLPNDTFGYVPDTPDQQGWWIRDELVDALCRERKHISKLEQRLAAAEDAHRRNAESQYHNFKHQPEDHRCGWRVMYEAVVARSKAALRPKESKG